MFPKIYDQGIFFVGLFVSTAIERERGERREKAKNKPQFLQNLNLKLFSHELPLTHTRGMVLLLLFLLLHVFKFIDPLLLSLPP